MTAPDASENATAAAPPEKASRLRAFGAPRPPRSIEHESAAKTRRRLKETSRAMPRNPGVYFFFGENERLLYIGKAKCLRQRVGSYFAETKKRRPPKLRRLLAEIKRLEWRECGSELEALLLERRLIATRFPALNRQHKRFAVYPYLLLSQEDFPRLTLTRAEPLDELSENENAASADFALDAALSFDADELLDESESFDNLENYQLPEVAPRREYSRDGFSAAPPDSIRREATLPMETPPRAGALPGLYLGPFSSPRHAAWTFEAVRAIFPLRSCEGELKPDANARGCFYHEIGRCCGPCVGAISPREYSQLCDDLVSLLKSGDAPQIEALRARMNALSAQWRYEDAERVRRQLEAIEEVAARLQRLERMRRDNNVVIAQNALANDPLAENKSAKNASTGATLPETPREYSQATCNFFLIRGGAVRRIVRLESFASQQKTLRDSLHEIYAAPPPVADFTAKEELDEMMILDRWLRAHGEESCCIWMNETDRAPRQWLSNALRKLRAA